MQSALCRTPLRPVATHTQPPASVPRTLPPPLPFRRPGGSLDDDVSPVPRGRAAAAVRRHRQRQVAPDGRRRAGRVDRVGVARPRIYRHGRPLKVARRGARAREPPREVAAFGAARRRAAVEVDGDVGATLPEGRLVRAAGARDRAAGRRPVVMRGRARRWVAAGWFEKKDERWFAVRFGSENSRQGAPRGHPSHTHTHTHTQLRQYGQTCTSLPKYRSRPPPQIPPLPARPAVRRGGGGGRRLT